MPELAVQAPCYGRQGKAFAGVFGAQRDDIIIDFLEGGLIFTVLIIIPVLEKQVGAPAAGCDQVVRSRRSRAEKQEAGRTDARRNFPYIAQFFFDDLAGHVKSPVTRLPAQRHLGVDVVIVRVIAVWM